MAERPSRQSKTKANESLKSLLEEEGEDESDGFGEEESVEQLIAIYDGETVLLSRQRPVTYYGVHYIDWYAEPIDEIASHAAEELVVVPDVSQKGWVRARELHIICTVGNDMVRGYFRMISSRKDRTIDRFRQIAEVFL